MQRYRKESEKHSILIIRILIRMWYAFTLIYNSRASKTTNKRIHKSTHARNYHIYNATRCLWVCVLSHLFLNIDVQKIERCAAELCCCERLLLCVCVCVVKQQQQHPKKKRHTRRVSLLRDDKKRQLALTIAIALLIQFE